MLLASKIPPDDFPCMFGGVLGLLICEAELLQILVVLGWIKDVGVGRHAEAGRWLPTEQVAWLLEPELEMMSWVTDSVK